MLLFRTICITDWKCRPNHDLLFLGQGTKEELVRKIAVDVQHWQAEDVVADEACALMDRDERIPEGFERRRAAELTADPDLGTKWEKSNRRFEMAVHPADQTGEREFADVDHEDGCRCTIVYHFLNDDHTRM